MAGRWALDVFPPFMLTALRFAVVAIALIPWLPKRNLPFSKILVLSLLLGVLNFGFGLASLGWGLDNATAIVVGQMSVPFSCMFGAMLLKDSLGPWRSFGLVIAMLGAVVVAGTPNVSENFGAFVALLCACTGWGLSNILMKRSGEVKIFPFLGWMSIISCVVLVLLSAIFETGQMEAIQKAGAHEWGGVIYLGVGSTVGAYGLWYYLLHRHAASHITPFTMMGPFVSFGLSGLFFDEPISAQVVIGGLVTILGVGIIVVRRPRLAFLGKVLPKRRSGKESAS